LSASRRQNARFGLTAGWSVAGPTPQRDPVDHTTARRAGRTGRGRWSRVAVAVRPVMTRPIGIHASAAICRAPTH